MPTYDYQVALRNCALAKAKAQGMSGRENAPREQLGGVTATGTRFTRFTSTKVQIVTPEELRATADRFQASYTRSLRTRALVLALLALLVQKYKY
jgi:hypothetical protein